MEVIIDGIVYVPKEKTELDLLKEKYESRDYICIRGETHYQTTKYLVVSDPSQFSFGNFKLIHKKHKDILDAYLADNSVEIEWFNVDGFYKCKCFIESYNENFNYRLKQQHPIFKRNEDGEVFRFEDSSSYPLAVISNYRIDKYTSDNHNDWSTIPYDKERGLYHLQPVFFKGDTKISIGFYSVHDKHPLTENGFHCIDYKSIEPITPEQLKVMPFVWKMYQQVLKDNK